MAESLPTPCAEPGCSWTGRKSRCPDHRKQKTHDDWKRWSADSPSEPFYGKQAWRKASESYRAKHPLCQRCKAQGRTREAELVHHIEPIQDGGAKYDESNLEALCSSCHRKVHDPRYETDVTLICGPSGSGKSRYVRERRKVGDLVVDLDLLWQALGMLDPYEKPDELLDPVLRTRDHLIRYIAGANTVDRAWFIATAPQADKRQKLADQLDADEVIVLHTPLDTCERRIRDDDRRPEHRKQGYVSLARHWWDEYERRDGETIVTHEPQTAAVA